MSEEVQKLTSLLFGALLLNSPVLSGNMKSFVQIVSRAENECQIVIDAPFYDMKRWQKDKVIVHTGEEKGGKTAYAEAVNKSGGFGTRNKSMHWVNRACVEVAEIIANEIGGTVINELEL